MTFHTQLLAGRWQTFSLAAQLGNIGSEIERGLRALTRHNATEQNLALDRALELFDATISDPRWNQRTRELTRAREVVCDYFYGGNRYQSSPEWLSAYFLAFAIKAKTS